MGWERISRKTLGAIGVIALTSGALVMTMVTPGGAASASDGRATFHSGNVVNCGQVGFPGSQTAFANGANPITAGGFTTTITGSGTQANISLPLPAGVAVQAVVVKGGPAYNVYSDAAVLPPTLASPQNYISPLNGGGNVPTISHWFICYTGGNVPPPPPSPVSLNVAKAIVNPNGATPETSFTVKVTCDDVLVATLIFTGVGTQSVPNLPVNSLCTIEETSQTAATVTYSPAGAQTAPGNDGVDIGSDPNTPLTFTVTNDYTNVSSGGAAASPVAASPIAVTPTFTG